MPNKAPIIRSPIKPAPPIALIEGWEVSTRKSTAPLRISDCTPYTKVLVRSEANSDMANALGVSYGRAVRNERGTLVVGSGPGEWLLISNSSTAAQIIAAKVLDSKHGDLTTIRDITHGGVLIRLTGRDATRLMAKLCPMNFAEKVTPHGTAFRSSVAKLATTVIRDDLETRLDDVTYDDRSATSDQSGRIPSYLLHGDRSAGQYLFDCLIDAGNEFGVDVEGFSGALA